MLYKYNITGMDILKIDFDYIRNLRKKDGTALSLADEIIVFDDGYLAGKDLFNPETMPPIRIDARVYLLCIYGEMTFDVDFKTYRLTKGSMFRLNGRHIIENIHTSNNYKGYSLVFSHDFILSVINWIPELKELVVSADRYRPLMVFDEEELQKFTGIIEHLKKNLRTTGHTFYSQIVKIEATDFILELADSFAKRMPAKEEGILRDNLREEILHQFMLLIKDHCKQQHEVAFYADKLNMTPGNLSRVITGASGKPPIKWIGDALVAEAKILLRSPDMNVQQASQELNFGDQSSFGKFFKKHTGLTPLEYKNNIKKVEMF